ncbi:MAG: phosphate/phosphite/phosphonate ABC transporter substrate-binding protein [Wenzhouxiangella sp.]
MRLPRSLACLALAVGLVVASPAAAQGRALQFQVHPIFPPEQTALVFQPLLDYLEQATDQRFELHTSRDFHRHWLDLRRGSQPDLVLEDAHLIALRMQRDGYRPMVRASKPTTFSLLTNRPERAPELTDFIGLPVASLPTPSLGHLVLAAWFSNPMQQPLIQSSATSWLDAVEIVFAGEADAAIVPHNLVARYVNLTQVATSTEFPHMTIAAAPSLDQRLADDIIAALLALHRQSSHFVVLHELDIERFVPASVDEYVGLERWLDTVYRGD